MPILNANTTPIGWPLTEADFRRAHPNTSLPDGAPEEALTPFGWHRPIAIEPPPYDPATQRLQELPPVLVDGFWWQAWQVVDLPPAPPEAQWLEFVTWLYQQPEMMLAMATARQSTTPQGEPATTALPAALEAARKDQNYPAWALTWGQFLLASGMPAQALEPIVAKAVEYNLPLEFIVALQPQLPLMP